MRSIGHRVLGEDPLVCFKEKTAVLMSASPGGLGGLRIGSCPLHSQHWRGGADQKAMAALIRRSMRMRRRVSTGSYRRQQTGNRDRQIEYLT